MTSKQDAHKAVVRRFIHEVMNQGHLDTIDDIYKPEMTAKAHAWIDPFLKSFSEVEMRIVHLIAEGDMVAARFSCSGTQTGEWLGQPATGRGFRDVNEVYFFTFEDGLIADAWGIEDSTSRLQQLGLSG